MPGCDSGVSVSSCALLIRGILAAVRQKIHLSRCPNLPNHLLPASLTLMEAAGSWAMRSVIAFVLGAFPIRSALRSLYRFTIEFSHNEQDDRLGQLNGVTTTIAT